jgi:hypothetical protein
MRDFIKATEYDAQSHAKFEDLILPRILQRKTSNLDFLEFSLEQ